MPRITTRHLGHMLFQSDIGEHELTVDVPLSMGGADRAPTPPQLFVASLGSCIAAFITQYCATSGLDHNEVEVDLDYQVAEHPTRLVKLKATVRLPHADCTGRETALRRVVELCPVHATIQSLDAIELEIVDGQGATATEREA